MTTRYNTLRYLGPQVNSQSSVVSIDLRDSSNNIIPIKDTSQNITITIPRDPAMDVTEPKEITNAVIPADDKEHLFYHSFNVTYKDSAVHILLKPNDPTVQFLVYVSFSVFPQMENQSTFDWFATVPHRMSAVGKYLLKSICWAF